LSSMGVTAGNNLTWVPSGQGAVGSSYDIFGQWWFVPTDQEYWPMSSVVVGMARMYQYFYLNSAWFELEATTAPGSVTNARLYWGIVEDPQLGQTYVPSYTSTLGISPLNILQLPTSGSCPAWTPKVKIVVPRKYFAGKKFNLRTNSLNEAITTTTVASAAFNQLSIPFGLWLSMTAPASAVTYFDIFLHYDIEFCELAPIMTADNTGGSAFSSSVPHMSRTKHMRHKVSTVLSSADHKSSSRLVSDESSPKELTDAFEEILSGKLDTLSLERKRAEPIHLITVPDSPKKAVRKSRSDK